MNLSIWQKTSLLCILYGLFTFRILNHIFNINIHLTILISLFVGGLSYFFIWELFSKEGYGRFGGAPPHRLQHYNNINDVFRRAFGNNQSNFFQRRNYSFRHAFDNIGPSQQPQSIPSLNNNSSVFFQQSLNRELSIQPQPEPQPIYIPPPVDEYTSDEDTINNILNNSISPTLNNFNNDFKMLINLASSETENEFNELLRDKIEPQLKNIKSMYDNVNTSLLKRSSDTRVQNDGSNGIKLFYNKDLWNEQQNKSQDIKSKLDTFDSQIKGFMQKINQQSLEESSKTIHKPPTPPTPPPDYIYIPPSSSYLSNYASNKYINQYI